MKKENADAAENTENLSGQQASAAPEKPEVKPAKARKAKKVRKDKQESSGAQLPFLVEFTYTISLILLIFLALAIIVISFVKGAGLVNLVIRTSVAILVMGGLLMLISSQISSGALSASLMEREEALKAQAEEVEIPAKVEDQEKAEA